MKRFLAAIDGSAQADAVCAYAAFLAHKTNAQVELLHVLRRHSDYKPASDLSGAIGLGARSALLEELLTLDEARGKLDQKKGQLILEHGREMLAANGSPCAETHHRRGSLVETLIELEPSFDLLFLGRQGEHASSRSLGSNVVAAARSLHKPLFVAAPRYREVHRLLLAYDGKPNGRKLVEFFCHSPGLNFLHCHLLTVAREREVDVAWAETSLRAAGYQVTVQVEGDGRVEERVSSSLTDHQIDVLAIGAYSHSRLHDLFLGSTTTSLLQRCELPVLLMP